MEALQDKWVFAGAATAVVTVVTYVWSQVTKEPHAAKVASKAAVIALFTLLLLTWIAHGSTSQGSPLMEPFSPQ